MRYYVIKSIYFKHTLTVVFKGESSIYDWMNEFYAPFMLLNEQKIYSVVYVVFRGYKCYYYSDI